MALAATTLPLTGAGQPAGPRAEAASVGGHGFDQSLHGWQKVESGTRLDRVSPGHGGSSHAARVRPAAGASGTASMTNAPALVRSTARGTIYELSAWVRGSQAGLRAKLTIRERRDGRTVAESWNQVRTGQGWRRVVVRYTARRDGSALSLRVAGVSLPRDAAVRVDTVRVRTVAPPSLSRSELGRTHFGASLLHDALGWDDAVASADRRYGRLDMLRVFNPGLPQDWPGRAGRVNRPVAVSFKADPGAILSGRHDAHLRRWFRQAPTDRTVWWTYIHEPEDNIEKGDYTASRYREAWRHIHRLTTGVDNPRLRPTLILMCWTLHPGSKRSFADYYPGDFIRTLAWDCYNQRWRQGQYTPPKDLLNRALDFTKKRGKGFGIAEMGSRLLPGDDGTRRGRWLVNVAAHAAGRGAEFVSYYDSKIDGVDFRLKDYPSVRGWRRVASTSSR